MKKKIISIILLIILCLTLIVSCAACEDFPSITPPNNGDIGNTTDKPNNGNGNSEGETTAPSDDEDTDSDKNDSNTSTDNENTDNNGGDTTDKEPDTSDPSTGNGNIDKPADKDDTFEDYGMNVITVVLDDLIINKNDIYTSKEEVGAYIYLYNKLPSNYINNRDEAKRLYTPQNKCSFGGATFQNREGFLPKAAGRTFIECDIDYTGGPRNALRIVYSSDGLIFYTSDHYKSFSIMRFV